MGKPILSVDFDGVIHSYSSGWKGPRTIPDPPVAGAFDFLTLALERFDVAIYSSRSHQWGGRRAMRRWMNEQASIEILRIADSGTDWCLKGSEEKYPLIIWLKKEETMGPFDEAVDQAAWSFVNALQWPQYKPPAMISIDDRAIQFDGNWPSVDELLKFKPWNKKEV